MSELEATLWEEDYRRLRKLKIAFKIKHHIFFMGFFRVCKNYTDDQLEKFLDGLKDRKTIWDYAMVRCHKNATLTLFIQPDHSKNYQYLWSKGIEGTYPNRQRKLT